MTDKKSINMKLPSPKKSMQYIEENGSSFVRIICEDDTVIVIKIGNNMNNTLQRQIFELEDDENIITVLKS